MIRPVDADWFGNVYISVNARVALDPDACDSAGGKCLGMNRDVPHGAGVRTVYTTAPIPTVIKLLAADDECLALMIRAVADRVAQQFELNPTNDDLWPHQLQDEESLA